MIAGKFTAPSPGTVNAPCDHRVEKTPVAIARQLHHRRTHVLAMHMANPRDMFVEHRQWIAAGKRDVPGVEQQADGVARARHQLIDVGGRFHIRAHVMMVREPHATA